MHHFYIIYSISVDTYYIGETHDLAQRLEKHNSHLYKNSYSKIASDWKMSIVLECRDRKQAKSLENFVKKMKSKIFIKKIINNPEILRDVIDKKNF